MPKQLFLRTNNNPIRYITVKKYIVPLTQYASVPDVEGVLFKMFMPFTGIARNALLSFEEGTDTPIRVTATLVSGVLTSSWTANAKVGQSTISGKFNVRTGDKLLITVPLDKKVTGAWLSLVVEPENLDSTEVTNDSAHRTVERRELPSIDTEPGPRETNNEEESPSSATSA